MKELSCQDLGAKCTFTARGKNGDEVKDKLWAHASEKHEKMMRSLSPDDQRAVGRRMDAIMRTTGRNAGRVAPVQH